MLEKAKEALKLESEAILELIPRVDENFEAALKMIMACQGRTVITGMPALPRVM